MNGRMSDVLSLAGYVLMVGGLVGLYLNRGLFNFSPLVIAIQLLAVLLMIWARMTFRARSFHLTANPTEGGLVTAGPYKFLRHPIYASVLYFALPGVIANFSPANLVLGFLVFAGACTRIMCEEPLVRERYPEYAGYAAKTKRLIPFVF